MRFTDYGRFVAVLAFTLTAWLMLVPYGAGTQGPLVNCGPALAAAGEGMTIGPVRDEAGCAEAARIRVQQGAIAAVFGTAVLGATSYLARAAARPPTTRGAVGAG